jgi:hypothetical protein
VNFADAAYQIPKKNGKPMSSKELTAVALREGLITTSGKTPEATMGARIYVDIKQFGGKSRFTKVRRGFIGHRLSPPSVH